MAMLATLLLLFAAQDFDRFDPDADHLLIDEVSDSFQKQWAAAEDSRNVKELLSLYAVAHDTEVPGGSAMDPRGRHRRRQEAGALRVHRFADAAGGGGAAVEGRAGAQQRDPSRPLRPEGRRTLR